MRLSSLLLLLLLVTGPLRGALCAQQPEIPSAPAPLTPDVVTPQATGPVSPGGAFLRAILVPGWGHAAIAEHTRGGFYFLTESAAVWMIVRTRLRLNAAKDVEDVRLRQVRARLQAAGETDPAKIVVAEDGDDGVIAARSLVEARSQQFEDWLVFGVFFVFLSGADAFVSAHLKDFPQPLGVAVGADDGGLQLGVTVPLGPGGGR